MYKFAIVGAGFSGAVLARQLADYGCVVDIYEARKHVAGNCYTERDSNTGILLHSYGPHIFHTDNKGVWEFVNKYTVMMPYVNRVKTTINNRVYSLPINLHTINQFFNRAMSPSEAKRYVDSLAYKDIKDPKSFEEQALKLIGKELYEAFLKGYTKKQWGLDPDQLPSSILKRLPIRFNYDDNYFNHKYQGIPIHGYTPIVEKLLDHENITIYLNTKFKPDEKCIYNHVFYTGPINVWFDNCFGDLGYRTLDFVREEYSLDYQGCAVMNYGNVDIPFTRITEHKYFAPWEDHKKTIIFKEYSRACEEGDIPYYPIRLAHEKSLLSKYIALAKKEKGVSFLGRLGTYRYLDMDVTIAEALNASKIVIETISNHGTLPVFFVDME